MYEAWAELKHVGSASTRFGEGPLGGAAEQGLEERGPLSPQLLPQSECGCTSSVRKPNRPLGLCEASCVKMGGENVFYLTVC